MVMVNVDDNDTDLHEEHDDYNADELDESEGDLEYEDEEHEENHDICIGKIFDTPDNLVEAYKRYAKSLGFPVRKKTQRRNSQGIVRSVTYCCNREGKFKSKSFKPARPSKTYRCGCLASITGRLDNDDKWEVSQFIVKHNHPIDAANVHYYRCHRYISAHVKHRIANNDQSGIKTAKIYQAVVNEHGGFPGCNERDVRNAVEEIRKLRLGNGDAQAVWNYFSRKSKENSHFYFAVDIDEDGQLRNVFWADGWSVEAYKEFGDVVSFDATYLVNKFNMPFTPFVGVNHHGQSILLGCGLLANEQEKTYEWLFTEFLKCMSGVSPQAIITDQDRAMQNAIKTVFPGARHRWCLWHVMKKVPEKFGKYTKKDDIIFDLQEIIYDTQTPAQFEEAWQKMLKTYSLEENKWLKKLYTEKQRWIPCFLKNKFWAGMSSTQRSESMNAFFDGFVQPKTCLKLFVEQYEQALRKKVEKELLADADSFSRTIATITGNPFEKQIQQLYTLEKFREFQVEVTKAVNCVMMGTQDGSAGGTIYDVLENTWIEGFCKQLNFDVTFHKTETYEDMIEDIADDGETNDENEYVDIESESSESEVDKSEEEIHKRRKKKVDFDVHCSCHLFEFRGILCRHVITILIRNNIRLITDKYILRRWRKDIVRAHTKVKVSYSCWENNESSVRFNQLSIKFSEVGDLACVNKEQYSLVNEWLDDMIKKLLAMKINVEKVKQHEPQGVFPATLKDPKHIKRQGRPRSTCYKATRSGKKAKTKGSIENGQDYIQLENPNPFDGVAMTKESMTQHQVYASALTTGRGAHQEALRGTQMRGRRGTQMRGRRGTYVSSPHTPNVPYISPPYIQCMGSPFVPYMDSSSGTYTSEPFNTRQPSFMEYLLAPQFLHGEQGQG